MALLGLLPSAAVIVGLIDIPPSLGQLVKIVTVPVSIVAILAIIAKGEDIARWSANRAAIVFGACALVGSVAAVSYYIFADRHVFEFQDVRMVSPIDPSPEILEIIKEWDDQYDLALENSGRNDELKGRLSRESTSAVVVMILLMVLAQLLLVVAMVGIAWRLAMGTDAEPDDGPMDQGQSTTGL
ncbi:MAG TPA: hypothetical protein VF782_09645 [Allosphingosinicella sp.]